MNEVISIFGLGKLGCTMLACFASKGWHVIGMDINEEIVDKVNKAISPIYEPGVDALLKMNMDKIFSTTDSEYAVINSSISFVIVPSPSKKDGSFSIKYVLSAAREIGKAIRIKKQYHLVVITSTVLPGDMSKIVQVINEESGKKCGIDFGVCYNPDFIALGTIIRDFLNPSMIIIGESDNSSGLVLQGVHERLVENSPKIHRTNLYNAELIKIAVNCFLTLKITFTGILSEICENMPGGDVGAVTAAMGDDDRIGSKYFKRGLSFGGPCLPRDNRAFSYTANKFNTKVILSDKVDEINNYHRHERIPRVIKNLLDKKGKKKLSVLGLTYKNNTTLVEESAAISIIKSLSVQGISIITYDPSGNEEARNEFRELGNIEFANSAIECIKGTSVCFIGTAWDEFKEFSSEDFLKAMIEPTIIDPWDLYYFTEEDGIDYRKIGKYLE